MVPILKNMIPLIRPDIQFEEVAEDISSILSSGRLTQGIYVQKFEKMFAEYVGVKYAFSTTSGTTALHLVLSALGIGANDEVLVSDFTFPASGNAIVQTGAKPVLIDCIAGRFDLDIKDVKKKLSPKTRAIMPIAPFGQPADMPAIMEFAEQNKLFVIEDAACALGAESNGCRSGAWKGAGCFSFHPRKVITTGEGGMITTDDEDLAQKISALRNHGGIVSENGMTFQINGFKYRMSEIQAALGIAQMKRLDEILSDRRSTAKIYFERLAEFDNIIVPLSASAEQCTFQSFVILLEEGTDRSAVIRYMKEQGIETTLGTYAMHAHPAFSRFGYEPGSLQNSWFNQKYSLTLPLLPKMKEETIDRIILALKNALKILK
jgi:perosamine synthetase